jgi:SAM-dependent methyltransferase
MSQADTWNERYGQESFYFGTEPNAFLSRQRHLLPAGGKALAVADGEGRNGVWLAQQNLDVLSVDFSAMAQEKARRLAKSVGVTIDVQLIDIVNWQWPSDTFDVIAAIFIQFCGPGDRAKIFEGIRCALKPGGLFLMEGYTPKQLEYGTGGPKAIENLYTVELLETEFASFRSREIIQYDAVIEEGAGHHGVSAVIDLIARK